MIRIAWSPVLVLAIVVGAQRASADDAKAAAKQHVDAATALHQHRHWAEALEELNTAYTLDPQPELLYAIAQLHVALGQCPQAITFYERFIATRPTPSREALARKAIAICKTNPPPPEPGPEIEPAPQPTPAPAPTPAPVVAPPAASANRPWYRDTVGDVLTGAGLAAGITAALIYRSALGDLDAANAATTYPEQLRLYEQASTTRTYALVIGVGGAALMTAGVIHFLVHDRGGEQRPTTMVTAVPTAGGGLVWWTGRF